MIVVAVATNLLFGACNGKIDRKAVVQRHVVHISAIDTLGSLTVGNGKFAFTADFTGLQSFFSLYENGIPLGTQSEWGWHVFPDTAGYQYHESLVNYPFHGRQVAYAVQKHASPRKRDAAVYFRQNPHRLHLGIVGLDLFNDDGEVVTPDDISGISQTLNPWTGEIRSSFSVHGVPVHVVTYAHPELDLIASSVESPLIEKGALRIKLQFPYPTGQHTDTGCDWSKSERHRSALRGDETRATINRQLDSTSYAVEVSWQGNGEILEHQSHFFYLIPSKENSTFSFSVLYSPMETHDVVPDFNTTAMESRRSWKMFWESGGAVDFSESTDERAFELERRVILSQYLTRAQCAGNYPPQETGLTYNSWHGKFHLEMVWWHGVHYALWGRTDLLERSLGYYKSIEKNARITAHQQGFAGVRWPKMTSITGRDSPSDVGSFLIWQQPHVIYLAELCYRDGNKEEILTTYADIVFATADFMASYAHYDSAEDRYTLGPALIPAQERFPPSGTINPPFELVYWHWGLKTAQAWRERLGLARRAEWDDILETLSPLTQSNGLYLAAESAPDSYTNPRYMTDHPMVIGTYGLLPPPDYGNLQIDSATMRRTFDHVWRHWQWEETWGWDFPMTAMAATRLGMPDRAVDALFMDVKTNTYLVNGHNYQDERLRLYLPGNGALLTAVAMMCAGTNQQHRPTPGFPDNGKWKVKWEDLRKID